MSLGAVDFGLIVDGAVVIVENVVRQLRRSSMNPGARLSVDERLRVVLSERAGDGRWSSAW
jgi:cobalt-zinc-cadmium resistance protein CzcA